MSIPPPAPSTPTAAPIGGYRLLRVTEVDESGVWALYHEETVGTVAGRTLLTRNPSETGALLTRWGSMDHPHVLPLLDVARDAEGRTVCITAHLTGGTLEALLGREERLRAGEAVTALSPVLDAVEGLLDQGIALPGLRSAHVGFDAAGTPHLGRAEDGVDIESADGATLARALVALDDLVGAVLARTGSAPGSEFVFVGDDRRDDVPPTALLADIRRAVHRGRAAVAALGAGEPVPIIDAPSAAPLRRDLRPRGRESGAEAIRRAARALLPADVAELAATRLVRPALSPLHALRGATTARARLVIVAGIAAVIIATVVGAILPARGGTAEATDAHRGVGRDRGAVAAGDPSRAEGREATTGPRADESKPAETAGTPPEVLADDPVAAARVLLVARASCVETGEILCLDAVDQPGSTLHESDLRASTDPGSSPVLPPEEVGDVLERLGAAAVVELRSAVIDGRTTAASLLMMKSEAGWRLRAVVARPV